jgi:hypothetical protein
MTITTTKPDSSQPAAEMAIDLFDNWFDPIETEVRTRADDSRLITPETTPHSIPTNLATPHDDTQRPTDIGSRRRLRIGQRPVARRGQCPRHHELAQPAEARLVAEAGYIFGLPIVMNYGTMYEHAVDRSSAQFKAPFNELKRDRSDLVLCPRHGGQMKIRTPAAAIHKRWSHGQSHKFSGAIGALQPWSVFRNLVS